MTRGGIEFFCPAKLRPKSCERHHKHSVLPAMRNTSRGHDDQRHGLFFKLRCHALKIRCGRLNSTVSELHFDGDPLPVCPFNDRIDLIVALAVPKVIDPTRSTWIPRSTARGKYVMHSKAIEHSGFIH